MNRHFLYIFLFCLVSCSNTPPDIEEPTTQAKLTIDPLTIIEGNQTKSAFVSLRLSEASQQAVTGLVTTEDVTTTQGEDYVGINAQAFSFAPGSLQENIKLEIIGDEEFEEDESFIVKISDVEGATLQNAQIEVVIENDDLFTDYNIPTSGYETPTSYDGMALLWNDEFDGAALNEEYWKYEIGNGNSGWGNNELQYYRKENTSTFEGNLVIQAREENFGGFSYTSSRIITKDKLEFSYGRVDIRAVIPEGQGIWPALWMLGANISEVSWPRCGEIDIMELVGHAPSTVHGTVHYPDPNGNHLFIGSETSLNGGEKFSQSFHVFSIIWEEDSIKWYLDDRLYYTVTRQSLGAQNPYPFDKPHFFIFNVAVGGNWPGSPDASTNFPQNMFVDYIRVFQKE